MGVLAHQRALGQRGVPRDVRRLGAPPDGLPLREREEGHLREATGEVRKDGIKEGRKEGRKGRSEVVREKRVEAVPKPKDWFRDEENEAASTSGFMRSLS